jgi:ABC-type transport system substrate-binding protein
LVRASEALALRGGSTASDQHAQANSHRPAAGIRRLVDIRLHNWSQLAGYTKREEYTYENLGPYYQYNPQKARELLAEAGNHRDEHRWSDLRARGGIDPTATGDGAGDVVHINAGPAAGSHEGRNDLPGLVAATETDDHCGTSYRDGRSGEPRL